ncbi:hypothetical protein ILUMI_11889 [Ignelater luminosus]|uniref:Cytochrome P450 n=1 Tax=Ignelater luminosus TaxID=2038154 RepID=A0A8K0GCB2_IGNLU|nr:hypothetical protein ILUMI_11889 [Ignelater luminosus]
MFWIILSTGVALFVYFFLIKPFSYWKERNVPSYSTLQTWSEIFFSLIQYRALPDAIIKLYKDFPNSRYFGGYQFSKPIIIIRNPDLIKQITVKDFDHFVDHSMFAPMETEEKIELWQKNLVSLKGDQWRDMRATLSPSFTGSKMKMMFGLMTDCAKQFVKYFKDQNENTIELEMKDVFTRFTNDVIASTAFGISCDSLRDRENEFYLMGKKATSFGENILENLKLICIFLFPRLMKALGKTLSDPKVDNFFRKIIRDNIKEREEKNIIRMDMIHLLMEAKKERSKPNDNSEENIQKRELTEEDITAQAMIFFFAGFETVATLMCFMAYELALNPNIQQRLQTEIDDTLKEFNGTPTYEAVSKMKYMDAVVSESLRKWPVAVALDRLCVKPYTIHPVNDNESPVHIKKGDSVLIPTMGFHRDPDYFPEPDRFDPDRFADENKDGINAYAYVPFGSGPRSCIGNRFALMETKLVFFYLLSEFDITVIEKTQIPIKFSKKLQLAPEKGFWLGLKQRSNK